MKNTENHKLKAIIRYKKWLMQEKLDPEIKKELKLFSEDEIIDAFYKDLHFGTGGLRGIIGAGTNKMNIYTVRRATQGICNYIIENNMERKVAIGYDSRNKSREFAENVAGTLGANGIKAYIYDELMPVPALSFATRRNGCAVGVMITASHNPKEYNGYKVYNKEGCQVTLQEAEEILRHILAVDIFKDINYTSYDETSQKGNIFVMSSEMKSAYNSAVISQAMNIPREITENLDVAYTPLNGAGNKSVRSMLATIGIKKPYIVKEQELPDGDFPTCPYPNPEKPEALQKGLELCGKERPDILIATDPDCDRMGVVVRQKEEYIPLTGNETGILLFDFICNCRKNTDNMPENPVMVRTVVTTKMADKIAEKYGVTVKTTLPGFKYIGKYIGDLEKEGREKDYIFGFEESYGCLSGSYVRDKDGVNASLLVCQMAALNRSIGKTLIDKLQEVYEEYGYCKEELIDFAFPGVKGMNKMAEIMTKFRSKTLETLAGEKITGYVDYMNPKTMKEILPTEDIIQYELENGSGFTIRPSGTEPKLKIYISAIGKNQEEAKLRIKAMKTDLGEIIKKAE